MTKPKRPQPAPAPAPAPVRGTAAPRVTQAFVDGVESAVARLLVQDEKGEWKIYHLPAGVLPKESGEGTWIELSVRPIPPPPEHNSRPLRQQARRSDRGGDFSL